jgi:hypothetical protein
MERRTNPSDPIGGLRATVPSAARPDYWDVTCEFHGQQHRVQMTAPPGDTVAVNRHGEPRA